jgi:putative ABC transport system ATP-binding protein
VVTLGQETSGIVESEAWLTFVEQFGFVSDRIALLDAMTVQQNLSIPFSLEIDPVPPEILSRVTALATDVGIAASELATRTGDASPWLRARVRLGRALALDPRVLVVEHPTATLAPEEATTYAAALRAVWKQHTLTLVVVSMDERFGKALGGRVLVWQPATGEFKERRGWF